MIDSSQKCNCLLPDSLHEVACFFKGAINHFEIFFSFQLTWDVLDSDFEGLCDPSWTDGS